MQMKMSSMVLEIWLFGLEKFRKAPAISPKDFVRTLCNLHMIVNYKDVGSAAGKQAAVGFD